MTFEIVVCIKQVPDTDNIKWTENNTIQREGLSSVINPYDLGAISIALKYKNELKKQGINTSITAVTMGPNQATDVLKEALSIGLDNAILLSDKRFSGADTLATAYTLSQFIKNKIPDFKLVICGQQAIDGDTAQTPSSLAEKLSIPQITYVSEVVEINNVYSIVKRDTLINSITIKSGYPLLLAINKSNTEITPNINGYIKAQNTKILTYTADDIEANVDNIGLKGSPTQVKKAFKPEIKRNTQLLENINSDEISSIILSEINQCRSLDE